MSLRLRVILILLALALVLFSLAALAYAFSPVTTLYDQATLAPTLFAPP